METRNAIQAIAVGQRHGGHFKFDCTLDQRLGLRRPGKKAESAGGVQFDVFVR